MFGGKFWEDLAGGTAQKWLDRLLSSALIFWAGGVLAYVTAYGWTPIVTWLTGLDAAQQIALALSGLIGLTGSAAAVEETQQGALRFLEGYWPSPLQPLRRWLAARTRKKIKAKDAKWQDLASRFATLTAEELETYTRLEAELAAYPTPKRLLPTRLGNRLRAAEDYAWRHYGLATGVLWPRLWLIMPEAAQKEITEARNRLDSNVRLVIWSLLFLLWSVWAWQWVLLVALIGMAWGYGRALETASVYGELLRAAFDLYRPTLYSSLRWPSPANPHEEHHIGRQLTEYLWRGSDQTTPSFTTNNQLNRPGIPGDSNP